MQSMSPFQFFKQQLESDQISTRINTIRKLQIIATLMSLDSIKSLMIPYLETLVKKQDDQVVFAIAQELIELANILGNQHTLVLPLLELLCAHDQTVVRQRAVQSIVKVTKHFTDAEIGNFIVPLLFRLTGTEQNFITKMSATLLMPAIYSRSGAAKQRIRNKFSDLSKQEMNLIQRITTKKISQMGKVYQKQYILSSLIGILKSRSTDEQDQIRVIATQSFKEIAQVLSKDQNKTFMMPLIIQAAQDKSWRVRLCLARNFTSIAMNFGKQVTEMSLIQTYGNLLKDAEVDIKIQAVKNLSEFTKIVSAQRISVLLPQILALGKDPLSIVRSYFGDVLTNILHFIPKEQIYQTVLPLIKDILKDDHQEIRKGGIHAAAKLVEVLGPESMSTVQASLKQCLQDPKWRVRLQTIKALINLAIKVKNLEFFKSKLQPLINIYLKDRASALRVAAVERMQQLANIYGSKWIGSSIEKMAQILGKQQCFHFKIAAIYTIKQLILSTQGEEHLEKGVQLILKSLSQKVFNVRQVCVKVATQIALKQGKPKVRDLIKKHLTTMVEDSDFEIRHATALALQKL